jgi:hypothetical protein
MRLPRVRFTVGQLLFMVAVVAANFGVFRRFYQTDLYVVGRVSYRYLLAGVGVLPLFNVALIGIWLYAARRLRSLRHGGAANPRSLLSGFAYFSLHFLMLVGLVSLFMPEAIDNVQGVLDEATEYATEGWGAVFGEPGGTVPWVILDSLILGIIISGPLFVLSGIGQRLARHCATTLPRCRFQALTCLVSLGFSGIALTIALTPRPFAEDQEVAINFQVVDRDSRQPIPAAFLCMTNVFSYDPGSISPRSLTDAHGRARLTSRFEASGQRNAFQTMGDFSPWGRWLEVSAAGYRTLRIPLPEVLGPKLALDHPGLESVALVRGPTPEDSFREIAGVYFNGGGFGGSGFVIEPDGRFAWSGYGCTYDHKEYGRLRRHGSEIELIPIPHPGEEIHPLMTWRFRAIAWGDRIYFASAEELPELCRAVLRADRPPVIHSPWIYPRRSDGEKRPVGLPRLPLGVWVTFLLDELSLGNKEGGVRLALESLVARDRD